VPCRAHTPPKPITGLLHRIAKQEATVPVGFGPLSAIGEMRIQRVVVLAVYMLIGKGVMAQEVKPSNKDFTYGLRGGVALTNYANNFVGNGKEAVKPVVGIFLEKPVFLNFSAQIGLNYAPHTVKSYGPTLQSKQHFYNLQLVMNGLFSLTRNSNCPLTVSGGLFGSRLLDMRIVDYDPI
jgi:hypothetical protein